MRPNDLGVPDIKALVAFGRVGIELFRARLMTLIALCGFLALGGYTVYLGSWIGAAVCGIAALVFIVAIRAETGRIERSDNA